MYVCMYETSPDIRNPRRNSALQVDSGAISTVKPQLLRGIPNTAGWGEQGDGVDSVKGLARLLGRRKPRNRRNIDENRRKKHTFRRL